MQAAYQQKSVAISGQMAAGLVHVSLTLCEKYGVPMGEFFKSVGLHRNFGNQRVKKATARDDAEPQSRSNGRKRKLYGRENDVVDKGWHEMCFSAQKDVAASENVSQSTISRTFGPRLLFGVCCSVPLPPNSRRSSTTTTVNSSG